MKKRGLERITDSVDERRLWPVVSVQWCICCFTLRQLFELAHAVGSSLRHQTLSAFNSLLAVLRHAQPAIGLLLNTYY